MADPLIPDPEYLGTGSPGCEEPENPHHLSNITTLGWAYLLLEIAVVVILAGVEWTSARRIKPS